MSDSEFFRKYADLITEADRPINHRQLQLKAQDTLYQLCKKAGLELRLSSEFSPWDKYPRLGSIKIEDGWYNATAVPSSDGQSVKFSLHIDVGTSNTLYNHKDPVRAMRISVEAKKLAEKLGGEMIPYSNPHGPHQAMAPTIEVTVASEARPKEPEQHEPYQQYDPLTRFLNTPGEQAKQRRVSQSAYSDSFGGDASNYRKF